MDCCNLLVFLEWLHDLFIVSIQSFLDRHDVLEGIGRKEVRLLLGQLVADKLITLEELNQQIMSFNFG